MSKLEET